MVVATQPSKEGRATGSTLVRCTLGPIEFAALRHVSTTLGIRAKAMAVRYAIGQQWAWAEANGTPFCDRPRKADADAAEGKLIDRRLEDVSPALMRKVRDSVLVPQEAGMKQWSFWATPEQRDDINALAKAWGFDKQAEAIRLAIRLQAAATGFKLAGGWPGSLPPPPSTS